MQRERRRRPAGGSFGAGASDDGLRRFIEEARLVANRLVKALGNKKLGVDGKVLRLSISVGGAVYPEDATTPAELLAKADEALYASKRAGKNQAALYGDATNGAK